ncbi:ABC transporter substrate-binding protein [Paraburkholderia sp. J67]|uniref:ABC transporter substrate-binding protein n=1 Tax=Paraburkholderia sp. J67 TaxID=2805435 RepID=UPI002ABE5C41|nr:ABC transporter substrate-binding protein [Paraburkholderia sp. J67]
MNSPNARRRFLCGAGLVGLGLAAGAVAAPSVARASTKAIRIASNPGLENATLNTIMTQQGYFSRFGAHATIVEAPGAAGPFDAIVAGEADVCMVSAYNLVLQRIERGAPLKLIGAGMRKIDLTLFAKPNAIVDLAGLEGKVVAVGPRMGLLNTLVLQLLKEKRIDAQRIRFVDKGSNDECYDAVVRGEADACCASISHLDAAGGLVPIPESAMWQALPQCVYQTAYASTYAIAQQHDQLVAVMAAYGALYDFLMTAESRDAFFAARKQAQAQAQKPFQPASAEAVWTFNQQQRPWSRNLALSHEDVNYLQDMYVGLGTLGRKQPFDELADMSAAHAAAHWPD